MKGFKLYVVNFYFKFWKLDQYELLSSYASLIIIILELFIPFPLEHRLRIQLLQTVSMYHSKAEMVMCYKSEVISKGLSMHNMSLLISLS